jgi:hypothetical protein
VKRSHALALSVALLFFGATAAAHAVDGASPPPAAPQQPTPAAWCPEQGGDPETRIPYTRTGDMILPSAVSGKCACSPPRTAARS